MYNNTVEIKDIHGWRKQFLNKRGLDQPNGDDLYIYKMEGPEFDQLETLFREWLAQKLKFRSVSSLVNAYSIFNEMFVLYASEWWKRKFEGGHWSWQPILEDVGIEPNDWPASKRSNCVKRGFRAWKISLRNSAGKRFLGSIAIQGGLPMNLMAQNQGSVARVLHRVVDLLPGNRAEHDLLVSWIKNLSHYLPITYRRDEIYDLLAEVILVINDIKKEAPTSKAHDVINEWKENTAKWKKKFPISVSDSKTLGIIENLVKKVAQAKPTKQNRFISVNRYFDFHGEEDERLRVKINFDKTVDEETLKKAFGINENVELDQQLIIEVESGAVTKDVYLRRLIGDDKYKFEKTVVDDYSGRKATNEIKFFLRDRQGNRWVRSIEKGEKLEEELPWIFISEEDGDEYKYEGQGSVKISGKSFIAIVREDSKVYADDGKIDKCGRLFQEYDVFRLHSNSIFRNRNREEFRVINKYTGREEGEVTIVGNEVADLFMTPSRAFRGIPKILEQTHQRGKIVINNYHWQMGSERLGFNTNKLIGPVSAVKKEGKYTQWKKRMVILPQDSSEEIIREENAKCGSWKFNNWDLVDVRPLTPSISAKRQNEDIWHFKYTGDGVAPESFLANVVWKGNGKSAKVSLQFPGQGVRAFDKHGKEIREGRLYSLNKLHGIRINIFPGSCRDVKLELLSSKSSKLFSIPFNENEYKKELRLIEYKEDVEEMLSLSEDGGDTVTFRIYFDSRAKFSLNIARYAFALSKRDGKWFMPGHILEEVLDKQVKTRLDIRTQRLDVPGVEDLKVPVRESGYLQFPIEAISQGPWILYPSKDSDIMMKPIVHMVDGDGVVEDTSEGLAGALNESDERNRLERIDSILDELVNNPEHQDWNNIARLAKEYDHLPLSTIDVWKRAIFNYDFMAMLAVGKVKLPDEFVDRFLLELPFMFEFIPLKSWEKAIAGEKRKLDEVFEDNEQLYDVLKRKCSVLDWIFESFKYCYLIKLNDCLGLFDKQMRFILERPEMIENYLYTAPDSYHQILRRSHDEEKHKWPSYNEVYHLIKEYSDIQKNIFYLEQEFRTVVVNTPILLAMWAYFGMGERHKNSPEFVQLIKTIKAFDKLWFTNAFNLTLLKLYNFER